MAQKSKSTAPGQYLGFSLQASRMLDHLLQASAGDVVSLEVLSDVATTKPDKSSLAEETKSRITKTNPLSDRSNDLWKTLSNWSNAVSDGTLELDRTRFRLYCSVGKPGKIASQFAQASDATSALAALRFAKLTLQQSPGKYAANFFSTSEKQATQIIISFEIEIGRGSSIRQVREALGKHFVPKEILDDVLSHMLGWLKIHTDTAIENGLPANIRYDDFHREVLTIIRKLDRRNILTSFAKAPAPHTIAEHIRNRTYIRQLELIELEHEDQIRAVNDFLKAEADRIQWAEKGYVNSSSFDVLEQELQAAWVNYKNRANAALAASTEIQRGVVIYSDCCLHKATVEGNDPSQHFIKGSYHKLSDDQIVGWHPGYKKKLT